LIKVFVEFSVGTDLEAVAHRRREVGFVGGVVKTTRK
jgi:hypothetical protein